MKNTLIYIATAAVLLMLCSSKLNAQQKLNKEIYSIAKSTSKPGWIDFDDKIELNANTLFTQNKNAFDLGTEDEMRLVKIQSDKLGFKHYRFEQYYKGIKISGAQYIVHENNEGKIYSANGKIVSGLNKKTSVAVSEISALEKGKSVTGAKTFAWENADMVRKFNEKKNKKFESLFPKAELTWASASIGTNPDDFQLCYKFNIAAAEGGHSKTVFISTETGEVVKELPLEFTCESVSNPTIFNGNRTIATTKAVLNNKYYLLDDCDATEIHIWDANMLQTTYNATDIYSANTNNFFTGKNRLAGVQVLWGLKSSVNYYKNIHNWDSYDGSSTNIEGYSRCGFDDNNGGTYGRNAMFDGFWEEFKFGYGRSDTTAVDDYSVLDVVAHEFTHGVTNSTAALVYQGESGALNESFSDIFGEVVEKNALGSCDMLHGVSYSIRNMLNPQLSGNPQPATYYDTLWATTNCGTPTVTNDYCGVHTNSGVQNRMFALLCNGGSGISLNGIVFNVSGIGVDDAGDIAYRALTVYLTSTSNYYDSREAWIRAANDIFGHCSNQSVQTGNAWYAVQVGQSLSDYNINKCGFDPPFGSIWDVEYNAINTIVASPSNCGNIIMQSNVAVNYDAAQSVSLMPGFHAQAGCHFNARIDACAVTNYKSTSSNENVAMSHQFAQNKVAVKFISAVKAKPNPFNNELNIQFELEQGNEVTVQLFDLLGKQTSIPTYKDSFGDGSSSIQLNTSELPSGMYILRVFCGNESQSIKVVK